MSVKRKVTVPAGSSAIREPVLDSLAERQAAAHCSAPVELVVCLFEDLLFVAVSLPFPGSYGAFCFLGLDSSPEATRALELALPSRCKAQESQAVDGELPLRDPVRGLKRSTGPPLGFLDPAKLERVLSQCGACHPFPPREARFVDDREALGQALQREFALSLLPRQVPEQAEYLRLGDLATDATVQSEAILEEGVGGPEVGPLESARAEPHQHVGDGLLVAQLAEENEAFRIGRLGGVELAGRVCRATERA